MIKNVLFFLALSFSVSALVAQNKKEILMSINNKPVYDTEFIRVYKKNLDLVQDEKQKNVDAYLELFKDYKLKITEAFAQQLDKDHSYQKEFSQYQEQLSRNYIFEDKVTEELALEAYNRGKEEVKAAHILILSSYEDTPQDTLAAYNKIKNIREKALKGEDFTTLAKNNSEEPNASNSGGDLGYFSVFQMVYPFESMAYATKKGEVSEMVRTQFGYHIIKIIDRRERAPEIGISHIMIAANTGERTFDPEERINEIYLKLQQGDDFESLAKEFSDDKNSAKKGGKLNKFSKGDLRSIEFENAAYSLKNVGDYTKPTKTEFGWHILKLDEKFAAETFEEKKPILEKRVSDGNRSKIVTNAINKKIKDKYGFKQGEAYLPFFETYVSDDVLNRKWIRDSTNASLSKVLFTIGDNKLTYMDFAKFAAVRQRTTKPYKQKTALLTDFYDEFETQELKNYFKVKLEDENEDYAAIISEYRNGLLIFDVMNKNIWQKAKNDTVALQQFYQKTKEQYNWAERIDASIFSTSDNAIAQEVQNMIRAGKTDAEIKTALNQDNKIQVIVTTGKFEKGDRELPVNYTAKKGVSEIMPIENSFVVINTAEIIPPSQKTYNEVVGKVISDYQNDLEARWMQSLRDKYKIEVNQKTLKKIKKELSK